jgi:hypothetical protein
MKMNVLDAYDRTCMHYAAIKGNSTTINTLFLLFKSHGGIFSRAELCKEPLPQKKEENNNDIEEINEDI